MTPKTMACVLAFSVVVALSGCATMVQSGPDLVAVNSNPEGARVSLDGMPCGMTPCTVAFQRGGEGLLVVEYPGYAKQTKDVDKVACGWFIGGILLGGLISMTVDLACHNQGKYPEDPIFVELQPGSP